MLERHGQTCLNSEVRLLLEHDLRDRKKLEEKCRRQADLLKERDAEIASLQSQLSLKEAKATEAIRLCGQISAAEATEADRVNELKSLGERNLALEEEKIILDGKVTALASAATAKDNELASLTAQVAQLTKDLSNFQLSCDELSVKAASLESQKDSLIDQCVCWKLHVLGSVTRCPAMNYLKSNMKQCRMRSWTEMDSQPWRKIGCHEMSTINGVRRGLVDAAAAYNPSTEANYVSIVNDLRAVDFPLLAQLESKKDASIADIMGLLYLEGPAAETPEANQLQPSPKQLMLPIHRFEEMLRPASYPFFDVMDPLIEPLFAKNLVGEASTSGVPAMATTTALSTTFTQTSSVPPISVATEVPSPPKIMFEKEELETTPEHATAN
ncbi:hypothetical protein Tco_0262528 [Tanacetum coccineum]